MKIALSSLLLVAIATTTNAFAPSSLLVVSRPRTAFVVRSATVEADTDSSPVVQEKDFDLNQYILERLPSIEQALDESLISHEPQTEKIVEAMKYSLMAGGKRIRPVLCLAAAEMFTDKAHVAMPAAVALEMIHTMSLIHDDLPSMDNDELRRGKPTCHVSLFLVLLLLCVLLFASLRIESFYLRRDGSMSTRLKASAFGAIVRAPAKLMLSFSIFFLFGVRQVVYGEDVAILAGDAMLSTAFQHVAQNVDPTVVEPTRILDVLTRLGQSVGPKGLAGGQVMDLECEGKDGVTLEDLRWIHTHKTATLLVVAVASGALLGGANPEEVEACEEFALKIGLAFQVADDILDVTQSTEELGKTAGKDEDTSKTTYPKLLGLDGSRQEAERLVAEAKKALEPFGDRAIPLLALADFIINRKN